MTYLYHLLKFISIVLPHSFRSFIFLQHFQFDVELQHPLKLLLLVFDVSCSNKERAFCLCSNWTLLVGENDVILIFHFWPWIRIFNCKAICSVFLNVQGRIILTQIVIILFFFLKTILFFLCHILLTKTTMVIWRRTENHRYPCLYPVSGGNIS